MVKIDFVNAQEPAINDTNLNQMQLNIENAINAQVSGDTLPVACIVPFTSDTVPENWLLCDGQAVSRTEYALLFGIIGTSYGVGDGSTTFNLPNLKGRVAVGKDSTQTEFDVLGETGGEKTHTLTVNEMPSHNHGFNLNGDVHSEISELQLDNWHWRDTYQVTSSLVGTTGGGQPHNILQPYQVTNYIIKARQSSGLVATVVDGLNSTSTTDALSANQGRLIGKYSAHNEIVVGHWIDNKPIYRKVFELGTLGSATRELRFTYSGSYQIITSIEGLIRKPSTGQMRTELYAGDTYLIFDAETDTSNNLKIGIYRNSSEYWSDWNGYAIVEYTKSTD